MRVSIHGTPAGLYCGRRCVPCHATVFMPFSVMPTCAKCLCLASKCCHGNHFVMLVVAGGASFPPNPHTPIHILLHPSILTHTHPHPQQQSIPDNPLSMPNAPPVPALTIYIGHTQPRHAKLYPLYPPKPRIVTHSSPNHSIHPTNLHTHTHTRTHTMLKQTYMCMCIYVCICIHRTPRVYTASTRI